MSRRRVALLVVLLLAALVTSSLVVVHSRLVALHHVVISGVVHETTSEVLVAANLLGHPPLIDVNTAAAEAGIERLPWVAAATVERNWPAQVRVTIVERSPIAEARISRDRFVLLDRAGRVLGDVSHIEAGLAILVGVGPLPAPGVTVSGTARSVIEFAAARPDSLSTRIASFGEDRNGVVAQLVSGPLVLLGNSAEIGEKYVALATLAKDEPAALRRAKAVDLREPEAPVLTP